jgi:hypothetical protein
MTTLEKCQIAETLGFTYNPITGKIYGIYGKEINNPNNDGYNRFKIFFNKESYDLKAHQFAFFMVHRFIPVCIDHINGDRMDNRISNLRAVSKQQNNFNRKNVKGYCKTKSGKYVSKITINGVDIYLGTHLTEELASKAYKIAKAIYHII